MIVTGGIPRYGAINRSHALARGLQVMFRGEPGLGNSQRWYDLAGNAHATMTDSPTWRGNAMTLNGTTQYGTFSTSAPLATTTAPFSVHCIVRLTDFASFFYPTFLMLKSDSTEPFGVAYANQAAYLGLQFGSTAVWQRSKTDYPAASLTGFIRHIVVAYNGQGATTRTNFTAYIDGVQQTLTNPGPYGPFANTTNVIGSDVSNSFPFKGEIYRAAVYNRELSASEAKMLYLRPDAIFNQVETPIFGGRVSTGTKNLLRGKFGGLLRGKF